MISYLAISGNPQAVLAAFYELKDVLKACITFKPQAVISAVAENADWAFVAYADSQAELEKRVAFDAKAFFIINGPFFGLDSLNCAWDFLERPESLDAAYVYDRTAGLYNCTYFNPARELTSFSDFSGTYPVYARNTDELMSASNRASALAGLSPRASHDLFALGWLMGHSNIFGLNTPYVGVGRVKGGTYVSKRVNANCAGVFEFLDGVWPSADIGVLQRDDLTANEWDDIAEKLKQNFRSSVSHIKGPLRLSLTGGKDSRLVLALAVATDLAKDLEIFTNGPEGSPEIDCAAHIASTLNLKHQAFVAKQNLDFDASWARLRQHNYRFEGFVCPWDGASHGPLDGLQYELTGFAGELYRGPGGHTRLFKDLAFLRDDWDKNRWFDYHQKMDPLGVLRESHIFHQQSWIKNWLHDNGKMTRLDVLPERFFMENRLSNWNGPLAQQVSGRVKLMPLLDKSAARKVFELTAQARNSEIWHYSLMARLCPALVKQPFLNAEWDHHIRGRYGLHSADKAWKSGANFPARSIQSWQLHFVENQKTEIAALLNISLEETKIGEIFDVRKLVDFLNKEIQFNVVAAKTILSAVGIAHGLLGLGEVVHDKC